MERVSCKEETYLHRFGVFERFVRIWGQFDKLGNVEKPFLIAWIGKWSESQ
jgi:hypothetical protein